MEGKGPALVCACQEPIVQTTDLEIVISGAGAGLPGQVRI